MILQIMMLSAYGSNYLSLMSSDEQQQQQSFNDTYTALILEEAKKLYNKLTTELTNRVYGSSYIYCSITLPKIR